MSEQVSGRTDQRAAAKTGPRILVDPRGQRFNAFITTVVLAVVLLTIPGDTSLILLGVQAFVFGLGAFFGLRYQPYGWVYRTFIRPRLGPPKEFEDEAPPRFSQLVGLIFVFLAVVGLALPFEPLAYLAVAFALIAAFLNAVFGFCLGCQVYLMFRRGTSRD